MICFSHSELSKTRNHHTQATSLLYKKKYKKWGNVTVIIMYYSGDGTRSHHSHSAKKRYTLGWKREIVPKSAIILSLQFSSQGSFICK